MKDADDDEETRILADAGGPAGRPVQEDAPELVGGGMPPAVEPEGGPGPARKPRPRWLVPVIAAVVVAVVAVAGLVGWRVVGSRRHDAALDSCNRAVEAVQGRTGSDHMAQYREAAGIRADQVKDAKTVLAMARSVKNVEGLRRPVILCEASMSAADLNAGAGKARKLDGGFAAVSRAARAVLASRDAKSLDDAKSALDGKRGEADKLLADSDGKVADNAVRDALQQAMSQAGQVKGGKAKAYQDAAAALQSAMDQVNASIQQKSQADQQAAAQQQAAQAQAVQQPARRAAPSYGGGRGGYTPSYRPSYNRGSGSGGGAAGGAAGGGASTQTTPQGGGSNWRDRLKGNTSNGGKPVCQKGQACGIG